jgi:two-component system sensor histidine kinase HydH
MWKGIVFPTIAIAVAWIMVSWFTTYYIYWLDQSYQRVFTENVAAIQAAGLVRESAWKILATVRAPATSLQNRMNQLSEMARSLDQETLTLRQLAITDLEKTLADRLDQQLATYRQALETIIYRDSHANAADRVEDDESLLDVTNQLLETAQQFRIINQQLLDDAADQRRRANGSVLVTRTVVQIIGQVLGIVYGWWMARRLQRTVARITVSLRDVTHGETSLGAVSIDRRQNLEAVHSQVEIVVARMREANDELQKARLELLRSERLAAVGELAAGVAHELRNPLTSVKLLLQYTAQKGLSEPLTSNKLQLILEEIGRMESTIQGLLDFSRPPQMHRSNHNLGETLQRAINLVLGRAQQQKVQVSFCIAESPLIVQADAAQLHQVFVNLLINGLEAMPDGGTLSVSARRDPDGSTISVEIRDTGPGISEAIQKRLFEPFATTKDRGTGLGLAVSRRIVDQHQGTILAENDQQCGAVFRVVLPAV